MSETIISEKYTKAVCLHKRITANAQSMQESLYEVCKGLKEMRDDKLYIELGYQKFEDYAESEIGLKRRQAYKYISIIENLPTDFVQSTAQIGNEKLYFLSTLSEEERTEIVENTDIENTSVKELQFKIHNLKQDNKALESRAENAENEAKKLKKSEADATKRASVLETDNEFYKNKIEQLESENKENQDKIITLEGTIEELENRPIDVAVESDSKEIENMRKAMSKLGTEMEEKNRAMQEEAIKDQQRLHQEYNEKIRLLTADYEKRLADASESNTEAVPDIKETFKAYYSLAYNSFSSLVSFIKKQSDEDKQFCYEKTEKLINILSESMKGE